MKQKVLLLLSGGPDSVAAAHILSKDKGLELSALTLRSFKFPGSLLEVECASHTAKSLELDHRIIDVSMADDVVKDSPDVIFASGGGNRPGKCFPKGYSSKVQCAPAAKIEAPLSIQFLHITAAMYAISKDIKEVVWAVHANDNHDGYCQSYIVALNAFLEASGYDAKFTTPFIAQSKRELVERGIKEGMRLSDTSSCLEPIQGKAQCGTCYGCMERLSSLAHSSEPALYHAKEIQNQAA